MKKISFVLLVLLSFYSFGQQSPKKNELIEAIKRSAFEEVKKLVEAGADVNATDERKGTPLMWAAYKSDLMMVKYLVSKKADCTKKGIVLVTFNGVTSEDNFYGSVASAAAGEGKLDILQFLIEECKVNPLGRDYNPKDNQETGWTPMDFALAVIKPNVINYLSNYIHPFISSAKDNIEYLVHTTYDSTTREMLKIKPFDINIKDKEGYTALHYACQNSNSQICSFLLENNANPNVQNKQKASPLHLAVQSNNDTIVFMLLKKNADVNLQDESGNTPLMLAAANSNLKMFKAFYYFRADFGIKNKQGKTAMDLINEKKDLKMINSIKEKSNDLFLLFDLGLDDEIISTITKNKSTIDQENENKETLLLKSAEAGNLKLAKFLIENGANLNAVRKSGSTPLHLAALNGKVEIAKMLVENKASLDLKNKYDNTPLMLSVFACNYEITNLLVKNKADVNAVNSDGGTVLMAACSGRSDQNSKLVAKYQTGGMEFYQKLQEMKASSLKILKLLLLAGADPSSKDKKGRIALDYARANDEKDFIELLENYKK